MGGCLLPSLSRFTGSWQVRLLGPGAEAEPGEFEHRSGADLLHDPAAVRFNRLDADPQVVGDLFVEHSREDAVEHLALPHGQAGETAGGASVNYGFPAHSDEEYLAAVVPLMKRAKVSALLIPGIGTVDHLRMARDLGVGTIRVATHCTEADVAEQHITLARRLEMDTVGFLMMAHMNSPEGLARQARLMEGYGANCICITDSAGHMLPGDVTERLAAVRAALKPDTELGFHAHHNLAMGVANSIAAMAAGATRIDLYRIQDVAEDLVVPIMDFPIRVDRDALTLGYAGVYGSFLLFAKRAEKKHGVPAREILVEMGRRGMVGGQEDMIEDTAMTLAKARESLPAVP